jgi:hypothetical protein
VEILHVIVLKICENVCLMGVKRKISGRNKKKKYYATK